jgi:RNA polymerase-binding transcription factor
MTNAEMNNLKDALEAKRVELMYELSGRVRELTIEAGQPDPIDLMQSMNDRDAAAGMLNRLSSTLADVGRALRAMADHEYGICTQCERPIAVRRLQTIPWASCCVRCQEQLETGEEPRSRADFDEPQAA